MLDKTPLLSVQEVGKDYGSQIGCTDVSFDLWPGEVLGIVGESGCGKSTLANTLMRLIPAAAGEIHYDGDNILTLDKARLRKLRQHFQMVFQNPFTSLNPRMKVRDIVAEPIRTHLSLSSAEIHTRVSGLLQECGLSDDHLTRYPHELSGG